MTSIQTLYDQITFFISTLKWFGLLDLFLVTITFYFLLSLVRRSSAAYLLREVLVLGLALFILTVLLPLPVFGWLVRAVLVATLVAIPIIFQVQLRHFIERAGRAMGISQAARQSVAETVLPELIHAVKNMSAGKIGALIALEDSDSLAEVIETGVAFGGRVTSETLQSIFYPGTPLHDGAVIIRTDRIVAAACVLPLSQQTLEADKRLGTRHRAAVGLSERSDALVLVVSEETGQISIAHQGRLLRPLSSAQVRDMLLDFYDPSVSRPSLSLWALARQAAGQLWQSILISNARQLILNFSLFAVSLLLAIVVWTFVIEQTNPLQRARVEDIPLRVENLPPNTKLIPAPPATISAIIQTTEEVLPTLRPGSFQAVINVEESEPGLYRLPIQVSSGEEQVLVLSPDPAALDLQLAPVISRTMPVMVEIPPQQSLGAAYELVGTPVASPAEVQVMGPAPLIDQVSKVQATLSLAGVSGPLREFRPLRALDDQGREITDVIVQPSQTQVNVTIRRRQNARQVSVRPVTAGNPLPGYWLRNLSVTPSSVTLQGPPDQLTQLNGFIDTLPVDISQAAGELVIQIPLDLPPDVQASDNDGNLVDVVTVTAQVSPRRGDLAVTRQVELVNKTPNITVTLSPPSVDLLLSGPLPILNQIDANPDLVRVLLDTTDLGRGQNTDVTPSVITPPDIQAQLVPSSILVTIE